MKQNKIQSALNKQAEKFQPKEGKTIHYQQPKKQGNRVVFVQPK